MKDLSLHILDLAQNSIVAGATLLEMEIDEQPGSDKLTITLSDNGRGMSPEFVSQVTSPFTTTRTTRKVGLGIPLFMANAEASGGGLTVESELLKGTKLCAWFMLSHIDRPPMGDIQGTWVSLIVMNPGMDFVLTYRVGGEVYVLDTREIRAVLEGVPLDNPDVVTWISDNLAEGIGTLNPTA